MKAQKEVLEKLSISSLNEMQEEALSAIGKHRNVLIQSPTGTGKTLAYLLPMLEVLQPENDELQALIIVPTRELAIQIENYIREMGTGYKCNAVYGGQSMNQDKINIKHLPTILIGTPGRLAHHLRRGSFELGALKYLVLDEFDKSLEIGFEDEMSDICQAVASNPKQVLTSATIDVEIPRFVDFTSPTIVKHTSSGESSLELLKLTSPVKDKLETLIYVLQNLKTQQGIIFCNFKDSIARVSERLYEAGIVHGCFHGGMEQEERELSLIKFRNATNRLLIATDLAARGLDIPEIDFILHYHLPNKASEFTHRNGRTARMNKDGRVYILTSTFESLPDFIPNMNEANIPMLNDVEIETWKTISISTGRRQNISKGDIAGFCFKKGKAPKGSIGKIELHQRVSYVAVKADQALDLIQKLDRHKLKNVTVRVKGV